MQVKEAKHMAICMCTLLGPLELMCNFCKSEMLQELVNRGSIHYMQCSQVSKLKSFSACTYAAEHQAGQT